MDFKQAKQKKERGFSVVDIANSLLKEAEFIEDVFLVVRDREGQTDIAYSTDDMTNLLGSIELGKQAYIEQMYEED